VCAQLRSAWRGSILCAGARRPTQLGLSHLREVSDIETESPRHILLRALLGDETYQKLHGHEDDDE